MSDERLQPFFWQEIIPQISPIRAADPNVDAFHRMTMEIVDLLSQIQRDDTDLFAQQYDPRLDFEWFATGELDPKSYKGKYIAIWQKQVVGVGDNALEVERLAKAYYGEKCRPAVVYVPENEDATLL